MKCRNCGAELVKGDDFCTNCGADIKSAKKKTILIIIISIFVALVMIAGAVFGVIKGIELYEDYLHQKNPINTLFPDSGDREDDDSEQQSERVENDTTTVMTTEAETECTTVPITESATVIQNSPVYYVSSETPDNAGIVVRSEATHYSEKITVLAEGTPLYIVADNGGEYIQVRFDFNGTETYGWVLGRYVVDEKVSVEQTTEKQTVPSFTYDEPEQYLFDSANKYITNEYLAGCTRDEITVILNEIYARHGYIFKDAELREYFSSQDWYNGTVTTLEAAVAGFNSIEQANVDTIYMYQKSMGWRS